ncbi:MAG: hypothetical protein WDZ82_01435 [Candidatus Paceibacterota bacterium]
MNLFQSYRYTWWQIGIFKLALLGIGVAIGAQWHELLAEYLVPILLVALVATVYIMYVSIKQVRG